MLKLISIVALLVVGAVANAAAQGCGYGPPPTATPEAFLRGIYDRYVGPPDKTKPIDYSKESELRQYFTPDLVAIILKDRDEADARNEVPKLDGDPFVGSQEWNIPSYNITYNGDDNGGTATVTFENYGTATKLEVMVTHVEGQWRISEIDYGGEAGSLRGIFEDRD